jgi:hypothetical protein
VVYPQTVQQTNPRPKVEQKRKGDIVGAHRIRTNRGTFLVPKVFQINRRNNRTLQGRAPKSGKQNTLHSKQIGETQVNIYKKLSDFSDNNRSPKAKSAVEKTAKLLLKSIAWFAGIALLLAMLFWI